jgi:hypothetical protein
MCMQVGMHKGPARLQRRPVCAARHLKCNAVHFTLTGIPRNPKPAAGAGAAAPGQQQQPPPPPAGGAHSLAAVPVPPAPPSAAPLPGSVPMEATRIVMHQIVAPAECDPLGICTGGQVGGPSNAKQRRSRAGARAGSASMPGCHPPAAR